MAQQIINTGAVANDGTGDPLRTAFTETNNNFTEIYTAGPVDSNVRITNNTILTLNTNGNLVLAPNGTGRVVANVDVVPNQANVRNIGASALRWSTLYLQYADISNTVTVGGDLTVGGNLTVSGDVIQIGNIITDALTIQLGNTAATANAANGAGITVGANDDIATILYNSTGNTWNLNVGLSAVGNITAPYFIGNGSLLTGLPAQYSNANVATFMANFGSNVISTTGNITGNYFIGDGSQLTNLSISTNKIFNGASYANIATADGNVVVNANGNAWTFGTDGTLTFPDNSGSGWPINQQRFGMGNIGAWLDGQWTIGEFSGNGVSGQVGIRIDPGIEGNTGITIPSQASSTTQPVSIYNTGGGGIELYTGANNWEFGADGGTIFPTLTVDLHNGGNQQAQTLQFGNPAQQAIITGPTPAAGDSAQRLIIQGQRASGTYAEGGDVYLWGGDSDYNGGDIKIYAGDSDGGTGSGGYVNIDGGQGADYGGYINLNGGYSSNGNGGYINITGGYGGNGIGGNIELHAGQSSGSGINGANILLQGGYSQSANGGAVTVRGGQSALGLAGYGNVLVEAGASQWKFDHTGNLSLPGSINFSNSSTIKTPNNNISLNANVNGAVEITTDGGNYIWGADNYGYFILPTADPVYTPVANCAVIFAGIALDLKIGNSNFVFDDTGNITLPGNTSAINYANGTNILNSVPSEAPFSVQAGGFAAVAGGRYGVDTYMADGPVTATLPASPAIGDAVFFADAGNYAANGALTIDAGLNTIMDGDTTMVVSTSNQSVGVFWNGRTWRIYNAG